MHLLIDKDYSCIYITRNDDKYLLTHINYVVWSRKLCCLNKIITTWTLSRPFEISITCLNTLDRTIKNVRTIPSKCFDDKMLEKRKTERDRE